MEPILHHDARVSSVTLARFRGDSNDGNGRGAGELPILCLLKNS